MGSDSCLHFGSGLQSAKYLDSCRFLTFRIICCCRLRLWTLIRLLQKTVVFLPSESTEERCTIVILALSYLQKLKTFANLIRFNKGFERILTLIKSCRAPSPGIHAIQWALCFIFTHIHIHCPAVVNTHLCNKCVLIQARKWSPTSALTKTMEFKKIIFALEKKKKNSDYFWKIYIFSWNKYAVNHRHASIERF